MPPAQASSSPSATHPPTRRRSIRLDEVAQRTVLIDRRTGTTSPDLWPAETRPRLQETRDIDDWLAVIAACGGIGITPEGTTAQYRRTAWSSARCGTPRPLPCR